MSENDYIEELERRLCRACQGWGAVEEEAQVFSCDSCDGTGWEDPHFSPGELLNGMKALQAARIALGRPA